MFEKEEEIFQVWVKHPFAGRVLKTECGKELRILSPGILNTDSGPDFFDARIELDGQVWVGNIEVHVKASDWKLHGHSTDKTYDNVILHVVAVFDTNIADPQGNVIPVLVLPADVMVKSEVVESEKSAGSGTGLIKLPSVPSLEAYGVQRLDRRANDLGIELVHLKGDMEALFQRHLFRRFGMRTNSEPFQQLAHRLPGKIIRRQKNNLTDLEALLFGQSGLLPDIPVDAYSADLLYRYVGFRSKYQLEPMYAQAWKFMRMRPSNFPTVRISQLAVLLHRTQSLYAKCAGEAGLEELRTMLNVYASEYWDNHFRFGVSSGFQRKHLGEETIDSILINAVSLLRYFTAVRLNDVKLKEDALELLRNLPAERSKPIRESGQNPINALESQGVLEFLTGNGAPQSGLDGEEGEDEPSVVSELQIPYFSGTLYAASQPLRQQPMNYDRQQFHRQNRILV